MNATVSLAANSSATVTQNGFSAQVTSSPSSINTPRVSPSYWERLIPAAIPARTSSSTTASSTAQTTRSTAQAENLFKRAVTCKTITTLTTTKTQTQTVTETLTCSLSNQNGTTVNSCSKLSAAPSQTLNWKILSLPVAFAASAVLSAIT